MEMWTSTTSVTSFHLDPFFSFRTLWGKQLWLNVSCSTTACPLLVTVIVLYSCWCHMLLPPGCCLCLMLNMSWAAAFSLHRFLQWRWFDLEWMLEIPQTTSRSLEETLISSSLLLARAAVSMLCLKRTLCCYGNYRCSGKRWWLCTVIIQVKEKSTPYFWTLS